MKATVQDLRDTLNEAAGQASAPDGLAVLQGVERGVARARRRTVLGVCSLVAAATGIAGALALGEGRKAAEVPSGPPTSGSLRVVTNDPTFTEFDRGFHRIAVVDLPLGSEGSVDLTSIQQADRRIYAWRYCTGTDGQPPGLRLISGAQVKYLDCPPRAEATAGRPSVLWLPAEAGRQTVVSSNSDGPGSGTARIAFYQEASWDEYTVPRRPTDLASNPAYAWDNPAGAVAFVGPKDPGDPNGRTTITVPYQERMGIAVQVRGPGSLTVGLNGRVLTLSCGQPGRITFCLHDLGVSDTFTSWAYGFADAGIWFDNEPGLQVGKPLTITVDASHFQGDDWRVLVHIRE
jgi:hypothetical protein